MAEVENGVGAPHFMNQLTLDLQPVPEYRTISLTQGKVTIVDAADYEWLSQWKWFAHRDRNGQFYAQRNIAATDRRQHTISMAEFIVQPPEGSRADHRDHDTLNNRRSNLRIATHQQNARNRRVMRTNKTGIKGVCWHKLMNKYVAQIWANGTNNVIGYFEDPEEAGAAYKRKAVELFGEFHCT